MGVVALAAWATMLGDALQQSLLRVHEIDSSTEQGAFGDLCRADATAEHRWQANGTMAES